MKLEDIKHIADIANISFTDEELKNFESDFVDTMKLIDNIAKIETEKVEGVFQVNDITNNFRPDEVGDSLPKEEALKNTEVEKYGYFEILKFVD